MLSNAAAAAGSSSRPAGQLRSSGWQLGGASIFIVLAFFFFWNQHVTHRYQVQKEDMSKRVAALQRQLAASQSNAMQAQFAHEEYKEIAQDEEEIRSLKAKVKELEGQVQECRGGGGNVTKGRKAKAGRRAARSRLRRRVS